MPTRNPRVNVVMEPRLYDLVRRMAERDGVSVSLKVRELVREALETHEDQALAAIAEKREKSFKRRTAVTHEEAWKGRSSRR